MNSSGFYDGREQTLVKHFILRNYLLRLALIVGTYRKTINYIDCFSGPWNVRGENYEDSSFAIALKELREARDKLAQQGPSKVQLRCYFLEKEPEVFMKLSKFGSSIVDAQIETRNASLENSISSIVQFVHKAGANAFSFIFIDPTGWTGFEMDLIKPLLMISPGEVLINFMTGHIRRFLDSPQEETQESFRRLFGSGDFRVHLQGLERLDREDAAVQEYTLNAKNVGQFKYASSAVVLHPEKARTHFHLIYLSRSPKGLEVFKEAEKKAMEVQESARAEAQQRKRVDREAQPELFGSQALHNPVYYENLRDRHLRKAQASVLAALRANSCVLLQLKRRIWG